VEGEEVGVGGDEGVVESLEGETCRSQSQGIKSASCPSRSQVRRQC